MEEPKQIRKQRRNMPFGDTWNQASWKSARKRAIASKEPVCAYCHRAIDINLPMKGPNGKMDPLAVEVDHIVPVARGGSPYELENLQLMHSRCNRQKGTRMDSDYEDLQEVQNPVPLSNRW